MIDTSLTGMLIYPSAAVIKRCNVGYSLLYFLQKTEDLDINYLLRFSTIAMGIGTSLKQDLREIKTTSYSLHPSLSCLFPSCAIFHSSHLWVMPTRPSSSSVSSTFFSQSAFSSLSCFPSLWSALNLSNRKPESLSHSLARKIQSQHFSSSLARKAM